MHKEHSPRKQVSINLRWLKSYQAFFSNPISMKLEINYQTGKTTNYVEVKQPVGQERNQGENFKNTLRQMKMEI